MIFPKIDPKLWAEKYGLEKETEAQCGGCKKMRTLNKPYATKMVRGLTAEPCECGCMAPAVGAVIDGSFDEIV